MVLRAGGSDTPAPRAMAKKFPIIPTKPERICWGCDRYCPADAMRCGNGSERTPHPCELFGADWQRWGGAVDAQAGAPAAPEVIPRT